MTKGDQLKTEPIRLTFGELEARLSRLHEISSEKRTQFQARLRNFQRLGIPAGVASGRGKTVRYSAGQVFEMALAVELTQLGLLPERVKNLFSINSEPIGSAVMQAANSILEKGGFPPDKDRVDENMTVAAGSHWETHPEEDDPVSWFLFFDPTALAGLTDIPEKYGDQASATFYYGGPEIVRRNIVRWTAGPHTRRLSFLNVTAVIWGLVVRTTPERQRMFCEDLVVWAEELQKRNRTQTLSDALDKIEKVVFLDSMEDIVAHADLFTNLRGLPRYVAEAMVARAREIVAGRGSLDDQTANAEGNVDDLARQMISAGLVEMVESTNRKIAELALPAGDDSSPTGEDEDGDS